MAEPGTTTEAGVARVLEALDVAFENDPLAQFFAAEKMRSTRAVSARRAETELTQDVFRIPRNFPDVLPPPMYLYLSAAPSISHLVSLVPVSAQGLGGSDWDGVPVEPTTGRQAAAAILNARNFKKFASALSPASAPPSPSGSGRLGRQDMGDRCMALKDMDVPYYTCDLSWDRLRTAMGYECSKPGLSRSGLLNVGPGMEVPVTQDFTVGDLARAILGGVGSRRERSGEDEAGGRKRVR
ncbi:hypothetical protein KIPB_001298 [Kipferlia bialata]|uniref:Uncharacterized protein n=1 Tax=Kipferlia bialata TaxID=797122 RepID=A0A9K3CPW8_9EUKA|nr:hypothetical protein KIPB_001298 [Kipferlia bialata]|eukprot:g1298.t1